MNGLDALHHFCNIMHAYMFHQPLSAIPYMPLNTCQHVHWTHSRAQDFPARVASDVIDIANAQSLKAGSKQREIKAATIINAPAAITTNAPTTLSKVAPHSSHIFCSGSCSFCAALEESRPGKTQTQGILLTEGMDYGRPMKPFFIKFLNCLAWGDNLGG